LGNGGGDIIVEMTLDYITQQEVGVPNQLPVDLCWSTNYIVDRLKQCLASVVDSFDNRTYYFQALNHLYIGACEYDTALQFVVYLSDLTPRLIKELSEVDRYTLNFVLKQAVGRIFEDIDFKLYHNSISKVLKVKLQL
jgi:hypothetical protein